MKTTLLMFTDGRRDCLKQTLDSAAEQLSGKIDHRIIVNDSLDDDFSEWLRRTCFEFEIIRATEKKGFCGAIQTGWKALPKDTDYVFHLEDDFTFNRPVPLADMAATLEAHTYLVQLALRRQPWNEQEKAAGGIVEMWPDQYIDCNNTFGRWLEHRLFFTTNPSLYHVRWTREGWPDPPACEQAFTEELLKNPDIRFGYWGRRADDPWVHHIGAHRVGTGY